MSGPPPRNFYCWFRWDMRFPLATYLWLVSVPFPLGAVGKHSTLTQGAMA